MAGASLVLVQLAQRLASSPIQLRVLWRLEWPGPLSVKREPGKKVIDILLCSSHQFAHGVTPSRQFRSALRVHPSLAGRRPEGLNDGLDDGLALLTLGRASYAQLNYTRKRDDDPGLFALSPHTVESKSGAPVPDLTLQPTNKWIRVQFWTIFLVLCVCVGLYVNKFQSRVTPWVLIVPALPFFFPVRGLVRRHFTRVTLAGGKLRYESGVFSKTTRTIPISKVQDVRAEQTFTQRLFGIGDVMVETAGEAGALGIANIDNPQRVVEAILDAEGPAAKQKQEPA